MGLTFTWVTLNRFLWISYKNKSWFQINYLHKWREKRYWEKCILNLEKPIKPMLASLSNDNHIMEKGTVKNRNLRYFYHQELFSVKLCIIFFILREFYFSFIFSNPHPFSKKVHTNSLLIIMIYIRFFSRSLLFL